jgi:hypothetical protein
MAWTEFAALRFGRTVSQQFVQISIAIDLSQSQMDLALLTFCLV